MIFTKIFIFVKYLILSFLVGTLAFCCNKNKQEGLALKKIKIGKEMFQHNYIVRDLPGEMNSGYGCPVMADFDKDGDLDYAFTGREAEGYTDFAIPVRPDRGHQMLEFT